MSCLHAVSLPRPFAEGAAKSLRKQKSWAAALLAAYNTGDAEFPPRFARITKGKSRISTSLCARTRGVTRIGRSRLSKIEAKPPIQPRYYAQLIANGLNATKTPMSI